MNNKIPDKPETMEEQVSVLWDIVCNHLWTRAKVQDLKLNFVLAFMTLLIAGLAVSGTVIIALLITVAS